MTTFRAFLRWTLGHWFVLVFLICVCLAWRERIGESLAAMGEILWRRK